MTTNTTTTPALWHHAALDALDARCADALDRAWDALDPRDRADALDASMALALAAPAWA